MTEHTQTTYSVDGPIARVRLDRPEYKNAQSARLLEELDAGFASAVADPAVKVIVMSGIGDSFSSGHDLGTPERRAELAARRPDLTEIEDRFVYSYGHFLEMSLRWRDLPKPTIAQVHGWCIFGGWMIASAMDLIVAADDARFLTTMLQYFAVPQDVGARQAKKLLFDPRQISAAEALELGFVTEVVPADQLERHTTELAGRIAEHSPFWLRMAKQAINGAQDAAGFRTAVTSAHAHYMLAQAEEREQMRREAGLEPTPPLPPERRRPTVERILGGART